MGDLGRPDRERRPGLVPDQATLVEFLRARLAEDERVARAAQFSNGCWHRTGRFAEATSVARDFGPDAVAERVGSLAWDDNAHIALHDPARVLAEVEAKRRLIELHEHEAPYISPMLHPDEQKAMAAEFGCNICSCTSFDPGYHLTGGWCLTLRLLALPWAGHEGYREEWQV